MGEENKKKEKRKEDQDSDIQFIKEDAAVVPKLEKDDIEEIITKVKEGEQKAKRLATKGRLCIICNKPATHCMRGLPHNTYCKECAKDHFKFLNYLEQL